MAAAAVAATETFRWLGRLGLVTSFVAAQCVVGSAHAGPPANDEEVEPEVEPEDDEEFSEEEFPWLAEGAETPSETVPDGQSEPSEEVATEEVKDPIDGDAEVRESLYTSTDNTVISTTSADLTFSPGETGLTFSGGYLADIISSASVDVVSAATPRGRFTELRNQGSGGLAYERGLWTANAGYVFSDENDWTSHTGSVGLGRDFNMRTTNLTGGYVFVDNQVFRADDDNFRDGMRTHAGNLTLTQVLGKKTTSRLSGFFGYNTGFQSSPYRYVPVGALPGRTPDLRTCDGAAACPLERHPRTRGRYALAATMLHYVGKNKPASIRADYRFYGDTWEVFSHTVTVAYTLDLADHWQLRLRSRTYFQDDAFFYRERYADLRRYLTVDRELSTFFHQLTGAKLTFKTGLLKRLDDLRIDVKGDVMYFHFFNFARLPWRVAGVVEAGLRLVF